jgi:hypothetical protein
MRNMKNSGLDLNQAANMAISTPFEMAAARPRLMPTNDAACSTSQQTNNKLANACRLHHIDVKNLA